MILNKTQKNKAFTLIELMIATSLFTIIMLMGVGSLIIASDGARASQKLRIAVDNVNFAMESMTRELRTGSYYFCGGSMVNEAVHDCAISSSNIITFTPQYVDGGPTRIGYYRNEIGDGTFTLKRCEDNPSPNSCPDIVSSNVDVQKLEFYVTGSDLLDNIQPSVHILMSGFVKTKSGSTPFTLQSMSSQRSTE
jgi:prepilin-type N-terminal cleavage/methylation domain-containing protein